MTRSGNKDLELSETDGIGRTISSRESQKVHIGAYCGPDITHISYILKLLLMIDMHRRLKKVGRIRSVSGWIED